MKKNDNYLASLPLELQVLILDRLDYASLASISLVDKLMNELVSVVIFERRTPVAFKIQNYILQQAIAARKVIPALADSEKKLQLPMPLKTRRLMATYYLQNQILKDLPAKVKAILNRIDLKEDLPVAINYIIEMHKHNQISKNGFANFVDDVFKQKTINIAMSWQLMEYCNQPQLERTFIHVLKLNFSNEKEDIATDTLNIFTRQIGVEIFGSENMMLEYIYALDKEHELGSKKALSIYYLKHSYTIEQAEYHLAKLEDVAKAETDFSKAIFKILPFASENTKKQSFNYILDSLLSPETPWTRHRELTRQLKFIYSNINPDLSATELQSTFERLIRTNIFNGEYEKLVNLTGLLVEFNSIGPLDPKLVIGRVFHVMDLHRHFGLKLGFKLLLDNLPVVHALAQNSFISSFRYIFNNREHFGLECSLKLLKRNVAYFSNQGSTIFSIMKYYFRSFTAKQKYYPVVELFYQLFPYFSQQQLRDLVNIVRVRVDSGLSLYFTIGYYYIIEFLANQQLNLKNLEVIFSYLFSDEYEKANMLPIILGAKANEFYEFVEKNSAEEVARYGYKDSLIFYAQVYNSLTAKNQAKFISLLLLYIKALPGKSYSIYQYLPKELYLREDVMAAIIYSIQRDIDTVGEKFVARLLDNLDENLLVRLMPKLTIKLKKYCALREEFVRVIMAKNLWRIIDYDLTNIMGAGKYFGKNFELGMKYLLGKELVCYPAMIQKISGQQMNLSYLGYLVKKLAPEIQIIVLKYIVDLKIETLPIDKFSISVATVFANIFSGLKQKPCDNLFDFIIKLLESTNLDFKHTALDLICKLDSFISQNQITRFMSANWGREFDDVNSRLYRKLTMIIEKLCNAGERLKFLPEYFHKIVNELPYDRDILQRCISKCIRDGSELKYAIIKEKLIQTILNTIDEFKQFAVAGLMYNVPDLMTLQDKQDFIIELDKIMNSTYYYYRIETAEKLLECLIKVINSADFVNLLDSPAKVEFLNKLFNCTTKYSLHYCHNIAYAISDILTQLDRKHLAQSFEFIKPNISKFYPCDQTTLMTFMFPEIKTEEITAIKRESPRDIRLNYLYS